ncbi:MAG: hypothetical protein AB7V26_12740 [Lysobacterales bacterium]
MNGGLGHGESISFRTVFLSDLHLGSPNCQAAPLAAYLNRLRCAELYLIGDVFDP